MFCKNCGEQMPDDAKFCEKCGTRMGPEKIENSEQLTEESKKAEHSEQGAEGPKKTSESVERLKRYVAENKKKVGIVAGVLVVVIVLVVYLATKPLKVDLNDYLQIEYEGYNTMGRANYTFDREAFCADYASKIKYQGKMSQNLDAVFGEMLDEETMCEILLDEYVDCHLDKMSELTNGEEINVEWECKDEKAKTDFGVQLSYQNQTMSVEGLKEPETVDPFESLTVSYQGVAPYGRVQCETDSTVPYSYYLDFAVEPKENLRNGDTVTVSVRNADDEAAKKKLVENYGVTFSQTEKTYTVEGLQTYITKLSEVSEDSYTKMKTQAEDVIKANAAKSRLEGYSMDSVNYVGSYLLTAKGAQNHNGNNRLYLVYEIKALTPGAEDGTQNSSTYYYTIQYSDLLVSEDGTVEVDLTNYITSGGRVELKYGMYSRYFDGYESLDAAYASCVTSNLDRYTYESDIVTE